MQAHRFIDEAMNGPHGEGECTLHKCDNRACVRPSHLFRGTQADNMRDMHHKGRTAKGERIKGSKLTADDVRAIRRARAEGCTFQTIADRFQISIGNVHRIVMRHQWAHVA